MTFAADLSDIQSAAKRIAPFIHTTPVLRCGHLDSLAGRALHFKCEVFQRTGSFKFRGASNAVWSLCDADAARGVATHSSGNHAQALACAARLRGIAAHVVMPSDSSPTKRSAVESYGGRVIECEPNQASRSSTAARVCEETGATFIAPYDNRAVIAGQGTIALELLAQVAGLDAIIVPVGGGGMISGITLAARALCPGIKIIGVEPSSVGDAAQSKLLGVRQAATGALTIADGLRTSLGDLTWPVVRDLVDSVVTVSEDEIKSALRLVYERMKVVIEPSAAVGVAAAIGPLCSRSDFRSAGVILCGGNIDPLTLAELFAGERIDTPMRMPSR
ncbi:MAG: pyridoxal-phosphate dependent enzyme [Phycisphaerales bacterium]|nr:pyridoxal-phosphate dependent enzyme [Phycisphaerales bacterium]